jgi:nucleoside phosphorylase
MFVCAGNGESFSFATPIGVGMVESAINLSRLALINPPEFILFVGSAGSYGRKEIFEIVRSNTASNIEHSFFRDDSYTPIDNIISTAPNPEKDLIVNSSNYITKSKEVSNLYLKKGIELENMEFFGVVSVAREFNIPVGGLFCVTNYCFEDAHQEFLENQKEAMRLLEEYVKKAFF